jgi:uncharacterized membrane protein YcaP (DUF421 family)
MTPALVAVAHGIPPITAHRVAVQAIKTLVVFLVLIVGFRVTGKREAAQLNVYDLAMLMALANGVQNAMTGGLGNFPIGLATSSTLVVAAWLVTRLLVRSQTMERLVIGSPVLLVYDGHVLRPRLRRHLVTPADLNEACHQHGLEGPGNCSMVVLEVDGSISVIPKPTGTGESPRPRRLRRRKKKA